MVYPENIEEIKEFAEETGLLLYLYLGITCSITIVIHSTALIVGSIPRILHIPHKPLS